MPFKITKIWAFVSTDENDEEGVCAVKGPDGWLPMVCADENRVESMRGIASRMVEDGKHITLVEFSVRTDVEEIS